MEQQSVQALAGSEEPRLGTAQYVPTEDTYVEMVFLQKLKQRRTMLLGGAILVSLSGIQLMTKLSDRQHFMLLGGLSLLGFAFILWAQYGHLYAGKRLYKNLLKQYGLKSLPAMEQTFYVDRVEVHAVKSDRVRTYRYTEVTQIRETKTMVMLVTGRDSGVCVPRSAFIEGHASDVTDYIRKHYELKKF